MDGGIGTRTHFSKSTEGASRIVFCIFFMDTEKLLACPAASRSISYDNTS